MFILLQQTHQVEIPKHFVAKTWFTELLVKDSHGLAMIYQELTRKFRKSWNFTKVGFRWGSMKVPIRICTLKKRQVLIRVMKGGGRMCKWQPIGPSIHPSTYKSLQISSREWKWKGLAVYWNQSIPFWQKLQMPSPQLTLSLQQRFLWKRSKTQRIEC